MAGGFGERFWPLSRPERPKQLLKLTHPDMSMLEEAVFRLQPIVSSTFVSTSAGLLPPIASSGVVPPDHVFGEPARRNTLGALVWTVASLIALNLEDASVAVVTADHLIGDVDRFRGAVSAALEVAEREGGLVTLGIQPTRPETGYGYIEILREISVKAGESSTAYRSRAFREKPDQTTAKEYVGSGAHLWNSGMFFFTVPSFLAELERAQPEACDTLKAIAAALKSGDSEEAGSRFADLPNLSIDYALMEQAEKVHVIPVDFRWDDVGAWDALSRALPTDEQENVVQGPVLLMDCNGCVVMNDVPERTVAVLGLQDIVVVNTADAVLVCHKSQAQKVKQIVAKLAEKD